MKSSTKAAGVGAVGVLGGLAGFGDDIARVGLRSGDDLARGAFVADDAVVRARPVPRGQAAAPAAPPKAPEAARGRVIDGVDVTQEIVGLGADLVDTTGEDDEPRTDTSAVVSASSKRDDRAPPKRSR